MHQVLSDLNGRYQIALPTDRYSVTVEHDGYEIYTSEELIHVVGSRYTPMDFSLKRTVAIDPEPVPDPDPVTNSGYQGFVYVKNADGSFIDIKIPYVLLTFTSEDGLHTYTITTTEYGYYKISLPVGRYYEKAEHPDYQTYTSAPGFCVVPDENYYTGNYFLLPK
jgi:hypothetical protein